MSRNFDIFSFAVALAVNLFLFGTVAALGLAAAFRLAKTALPRVRYLVAVAAFLIAACFPFAVTLRGGFTPQSVWAVTAEPKQTDNINFQQETVAIEQPTSQIVSAAAIKEQSAALDSFIFYVGSSELAKIFFAVWILVAALLLFREFISHLMLARMRKRLRSASAALRRDLLCPDDIRLYISQSETPATVGLFRPVVILPAHFPDGISGAAARSILRHETSHARWRDPLTGALLRIVRAVFWISPALWFIERVVRDEREAAADCAALAAFANPADADGSAAVGYAASLVVIAKFSKQLSRQKQLGAAAIHFGGSSRLENRVHRLLAGYAKPSSSRLSLAAVVILFSFLGMTFLPVASQPLRPNQRLLAGRKSNDIFQRNNFIEQNSFADFEKTTEGDESEKDWRNPFSIAADKSKKGNFNDSAESKSSVSARPTPPVNSEEKPGKARWETKKNESSDDVILPVQTQEAVKPIPAIVLVPATPAEKPVLPRIPELPKLKPVPELPKLNLVVEPVQNPMPKR